MSSYILRNIDPELWKAVKAKAEKDGHSLKWVLVSLLTSYAKAEPDA